MGVTYKLKDEVVHFIISQRQSNPLFSCRQLAESASQKFGLNLSKSSVHDVLRESGIVTPRGRKPKEKFEIPQEKKRQIQTSLSQVKLLSPPERPESKLMADVIGPQISFEESPKETIVPPILKEASDMETSPEYEGAGKVFLKAARWDLGIFSDDNIKESDWKYYLTYTKDVKVILENDKSFFVEFILPIERCIREVADGLVNNVKPFLVHNVSDEELLKACMDAQDGAKIKNILIVGQNDHILVELPNIVEFKREYLLRKILFVENYEKNDLKRSTSIFFPQTIDSNRFVEEILSLRGFDSTSKGENNITLSINSEFKGKDVLQEAIERFNEMYLRDEKDRLVRVKLATRGIEI